MRLFHSLAARLAWLLCFHSSLAAPALHSIAEGQHDASQPFSIGYVFTVSKEVTMHAMGQFDVRGNGVSHSAKVALFDWDRGSKIIETTLKGATKEETGCYDTHFIQVPPTKLIPGTRYLIATEVDAHDFAYGKEIMKLDPAVQWHAGRATPIHSPSMPDSASLTTFPIERTSEPAGSYFGPNMKFTAATPPSGVVITSPTNRSIFQRTKNRGNIPISGRFTGRADAMEARAVVMTGEGQSGASTHWQIIDNSPRQGVFSGTLRNVPAGGWYQIEVRTRTSGVPGTPAILPKIGIGDLYVTCGQSNSANYGERSYTAKDDRVCACSSLTPVDWVLAADPLPLAGGSGGSVWPRLGDLLAAEENIPIGFVSLGVGSTQVAQWLPDSEHYRKLLQPALRALPNRDFRAILWHQGESDSIAQSSTELYANRLRSIIQQSRNDAAWPVPWYVAEASFHPATALAHEEPVAAGQRLVIDSDPLVFCGPRTDDFHLQDAHGGMLVDTVHFNNAGLLAHAHQWRDILLGKALPAIPNSGFEENRTPTLTNLPPLADGASHVVNMASDLDSPAVMGWRILRASGSAAADGSNGFHNPSRPTFSAAVDSSHGGVLGNMLGPHVAFLEEGSPGNHFFTNSRIHAHPQTIYTLTVAIGVRDDPSSYGIARLEMTANGKVVASARFTKAQLDALHGGNSAGSFTDASISWNSEKKIAAHSVIGIRIVKEMGARTVIDFDHVRLTSQATAKE